MTKSSEHTHKVRYLSPNTLGLNNSYVNTIMGRTVVVNVEECRKAGCKR